MTRVAILGAAGRMGRMLVKCGSAMKDVQVTAAIDQAGHTDLGKNAGVLAGVANIGVNVVADMNAISAADVVIDFTFHSAAPANLQAAVAQKKAFVLGTTGLTDTEAAAVRDAARHIPVMWAPNMSLGMNLLFALVEKASKVLGTSYDIEIVEMHHRHKKDAPSGSAMQLAQKAADGRGQNLKEVACYGREGITGERPVGQIAVHAVRGGDIVGDHTVILANDGERVELGHRATSRETFANGALRAAVWLQSQKPGLYNMQDMLGL